MPKSNKSVKTKTPDVLKKKHIVNPYNCNWFKSPDKPIVKRHTAIYTK